MFYNLWKKNTLEKYKLKCNRILTLKKKTILLTDKEIEKKIVFFRQKIQNARNLSQTLEKYLVPIYALIREIIYRKIGLWLFPTQVLGGIVLHYGNVAQMNTGEGKTLTAILPVCLNALTGKQVYVITVNEYLSHRDWKLAKPIFDFFQITSGVNSSNLGTEEKKKLYQNLIIYTTNSELGFDYLRNNLVTNFEEKTLAKDLYYALSDEVDLTIDESQNPLIISQRWGKDAIGEEKYRLATQLVNSLEEKKDYFIDEKENEVWLMLDGIVKAENFYQITNLFSFVNRETNFLLHNALKAKHLYQNNVEYIVDRKNEKIILIDRATGRLAYRRVYSAGIQQAIESKEKVSISPQSKSIATITYQNFFRLFEKMAGMTGTAKTEEEEFRQIYGMPVFVIPPYKKLRRIDRPDLIFLDENSVCQAIIQRIEKTVQTTKRPILVGSPSVEVSEYLSNLLLEKSINHFKLNATNHEQEAEIIAQAGQLGRITISTDMAGRGTDIIPSEESLKVGGLLVIIFGKRFSKRIEDQFRGRAGRQGNPGESQCYFSLDDELIKKFALKEKILAFLGQKKLKSLFSSPLQGKMLERVANEGQEASRNAGLTSRQNTLNYDSLISEQRKKIYNYRDLLLTTPDLKKIILKNYKKSTEINDFSSEYLRPQLVKKIDYYWSNYLEALTKIRNLIGMCVYLPQEPQEAFFWETDTLFQKTCQQIKKDLKKILLENSVA